MNERLDFPAERRVGSWLIRIWRNEGSCADFVVDASFDDAERLVQWIWNTHRASGHAVWHLSVEELRARFPGILEEAAE